MCRQSKKPAGLDDLALFKAKENKKKGIKKPVEAKRAAPVTKVGGSSKKQMNVKCPNCSADMKARHQPPLQ